MNKYEEEKYRMENIGDKIYPWVKEELRDSHALNGKNISAKDTPLISFVGDLTVMLVIQRGEDAYEIIKDNMLPPDCDIERSSSTTRPVKILPEMWSLSLVTPGTEDLPFLRTATTRPAPCASGIYGTCAHRSWRTIW